MEANTPMSLWQMLEQMTTEQLDKMLHQELKEKPANAESVRLILDVLYQREKDIPIAVTPQIETAWKQYKQDTALLARQRNRKKQFLRSIIGIASTAAVLAVMVTSVLPKYVEADNFWGRMARWSSSPLLTILTEFPNINFLPTIPGSRRFMTPWNSTVQESTQFLCGCRKTLFWKNAR